MVSQTPLQGVELVSCAKANAKYGKAVAARQCGYGEEIETFEKSLQDACEEAGVDVEQLSDLLTPQEMQRSRGSIEVSPNTLDEDL
ncbi:MAG: hypothetical protein ACFE0J_04905 [Elainellaceae cyanobacterium]